MKPLLIWCIAISIYLPHTLFGQNVSVRLGPNKIGINEAWTITATIQNAPLKSYSGFPNIKEFRKGGTSTQSETSVINGQMSTLQSVTMRYFPTQQGVVVVPAFKLKIGDQTVSSPGKSIRVGPAVQNQQRDPFRSLFDRDPAGDFFGGNKTEFVDVKENAFLALTTSKSEVYVGENFTATLSFLVADKNRAPMQFHDLGKQLSGILKKIKPSNCWEENFNIEDIKGEPILIKDQRYTQYKIYQATFYPLNAQPVRFPSIGLEMIKFKVAKNPSFFGQNRKADYKFFYSKPQTVKVKKLPPHPLRKSVSVGDYYLDEQLSTTDVKTGQSVSYNFKIYGEGNIAAIEKPMLIKDENFDFYDPNIKQNIRRINGRVAGTKSFNYYMIPKEPGTYSLKNYFKWVFFNLKTHKYDTLQPQKTIQVIGESQKNKTIESTDAGSFYDLIKTSDNTLHSTHTKTIKIGINIFIGLVLLASLFLIFKK